MKHFLLKGGILFAALLLSISLNAQTVQDDGRDSERTVLASKQIVDLPGFPLYEITGDQLYDEQQYAAKKEAWIANNPTVWKQWKENQVLSAPVKDEEFAQQERQTARPE